MPEILKNIKAEDRLKKIRIVSENDDVMGGQPDANGMKENDNNAIFDLACSVMHALAEVAKVDQKAIPQILDALGDSRTAGASQRIVNEVNKLAKAAQIAANQANDKANTANTAAATADKKAVAAQNTANSANAAAKKAQTTADTAFKLLGDLKTINLDTLNSDDKCGVYYQTANANATPERNYPVKLAGTLEVFIAAGMTQRYTVYSTHDVYIRNNYGGKWDAWTKIPNTSDLIKVSDAFGDSRTLAGSQRTINEANRAAKAAQTAANQANDKANTANTAAATADKKAVAAQNKADSAYNLANTANGAAANALKVANTKTTEAWVKSQNYLTKVSANIDYTLVDFGTMTNNQRKVMSNPFGNSTPVITTTEILIHDSWTQTFQGTVGYGTHGGFLVGAGLVVRTGVHYMNDKSIESGMLAETRDLYREARVRMHVWRVSK